VTRSTTTAPFVFGHRGASLERPENTLESFALAVELGVTHLESDVHMTRDGVLVVAHDPDGVRMANVDREIRACTYDEIARWDAGHGFLDASGARPFAQKGLVVPRLIDVVDAFPGVPLNLDMKQTEPSLVAPLVELLRRSGAAERTVLASFSGANLARARALSFEGGLALSRTEIALAAFAPRAAARIGISSSTKRRAQVPLRAGPFTLATEGFVARCRALDVAVDYWTVNDAETARALVARGADGIMTDDPRVVVPAVRGA